MNDRRRTIGAFILICIVLLFIIIGGVRLVKGRDVAVATKSTPAPTVAKTPQQEPKKQESSNSAVPLTTPGASSSPVPSSTSAPQPAPSRPDTSSTPPQVPVTGPSIFDLALTGVLMMIAAYFGMSLRRTRNAYKRYIYNI